MGRLATPENLVRAAQRGFATEGRTLDDHLAALERIYAVAESAR
jgi:hypothetical protein